jgi:mRNA interferase HigB
LLPHWEHAILFLVRVIARRALREFWETHPDSEQALRAWYHDARKADWRSPIDIKRLYANASIVAENRVVFNVKGNKYRLVVAINYPYRVCYIRFVGTHKAYDKVDVVTV